MSKHVVIIGGGVVGLCCAYYLRQRGHKVTVVERGAEEHDCCSMGNAGMIVPSHFIPLAAPGMVSRGLRWMFNSRSPFYIRPRLSSRLLGWGLRFIQASTEERVRRSAPVLRDLHLASRELFLELAGRTGNEFGLQPRGLLALCRTHEALEEEAKVAEFARQLGMPAEVVGGKRLAELEPEVRLNVAGGIYFHLDCHLPPHRFMAVMQRLVRESGVEFRFGTEVTGWHRSGRRIHAALTSQAVIDGDEFVIAGGAFSCGVLRGLGLSLPLEPGKGYSLTCPHPPRLPRLGAILVEARVALTPMDSALRIGGTMELSGFDHRIRPRRIQGIVEALPDYLPDFRPEDFRGIQPWYGFRPCSPDGLPYIGRFGRYPNLCAATSHAMLGLSLGPVTGRLVSDILSDVKPSVAIGALNPDRYA